MKQFALIGTCNDAPPGTPRDKYSPSGPGVGMLGEVLSPSKSKTSRFAREVRHFSVGTMVLDRVENTGPWS